MAEETDSQTPTDSPTGLPVSAGYAALSLRVKALYHNCLSAACFAREDAERETDEAEKRTLRLKAQCYEEVAGWLRHADKSA